MIGRNFRFPSNTNRFMETIHIVIKKGIKKLPIKKYIEGSNSFPVKTIDKNEIVVGHHGWYIPNVAIPTYKNNLFLVSKYLWVINRLNIMLITIAIVVNNPLRKSSGSNIILCKP